MLTCRRKSTARWLTGEAAAAPPLPLDAAMDDIPPPPLLGCCLPQSPHREPHDTAPARPPPTPAAGASITLILKNLHDVACRCVAGAVYVYRVCCGDTSSSNDKREKEAGPEGGLRV